MESNSETSRVEEVNDKSDSDDTKKFPKSLTKSWVFIGTELDASSKRTSDELSLSSPSEGVEQLNEIDENPQHSDHDSDTDGISVISFASNEETSEISTDSPANEDSDTINDGTAVIDGENLPLIERNNMGVARIEEMATTDTDSVNILYMFALFIVFLLIPLQWYLAPSLEDIHSQNIDLEAASMTTDVKELEESAKSSNDMYKEMFDDPVAFCSKTHQTDDDVYRDYNVQKCIKRLKKGRQKLDKIYHRIQSKLESVDRSYKDKYEKSKYSKKQGVEENEIYLTKGKYKNHKKGHEKVGKGGDIKISKEERMSIEKDSNLSDHSHNIDISKVNTEEIGERDRLKAEYNGSGNLKKKHVKNHKKDAEKSEKRRDTKISMEELTSEDADKYSSDNSYSSDTSEVDIEGIVERIKCQTGNNRNENLEKKLQKLKDSDSEKHKGNEYSKQKTLECKLKAKEKYLKLKEENLKHREQELNRRELKYKLESIDNSKEVNTTEKSRQKQLKAEYKECSAPYKFDVEQNEVKKEESKSESANFYAYKLDEELQENKRKQTESPSGFKGINDKYQANKNSFENTDHNKIGDAQDKRKKKKKRKEKFSYYTQDSSESERFDSIDDNTEFRKEQRSRKKFNNKQSAQQRESNEDLNDKINYYQDRYKHEKTYSRRYKNKKPQEDLDGSKPGQWYVDLFAGRSEMRRENERREWLFDRARSRDFMRKVNLYYSRYSAEPVR